MANDRKSETKTLSTSLMHRLDEYRHQHTLQKCEALEKAVREFLDSDEVGEIEGRLRAERDSLVSLAAHLREDAGGTPLEGVGRQPRHNNYFDARGDREKYTFSFSEALMDKVRAEVNSNDTYTYTRDLIERAIWEMLCMDREERLDLLMTEIEDLTDYISERFEYGREHNGYVSLVDDETVEIQAKKARASEDEEFESEFVDTDDTELDPSLEDCKQAGRPFTLNELRRVSEYAYDFGLDFELHPDRVDNDVMIQNRRLIKGLAFGVLNHEEMSDNAPRVEIDVVRAAIRAVAPSSVDEEIMFERDYGMGSYLSDIVDEFLYPEIRLEEGVDDAEPFVTFALSWDVFESFARIPVEREDTLYRGARMLEQEGSQDTIRIPEWARVRADLLNIDLYVEEYEARTEDSMSQDVLETRVEILSELNDVLRSKEWWMVAEYLDVPDRHRISSDEKEEPKSWGEKYDSRKFGNKKSLYYGLVG